MTTRLDELFAPDRLRQNWEMQLTPVPEPPQITHNLEIRAQYDKSLRLIGEKFPDVSRLSGRFDELSEKINRTFPLDATASPVDAEQKETIVDMLEQLEELLWAMSLPKGGAR